MDTKNTPLLADKIQRDLVAMHEAVELEPLGFALLRLMETLFPLRASAVIFRPLEFESSMLFARPSHRIIFGEWIEKLHPDDVWLARKPPAPGHTVVRHTDHTPDALLLRTSFYRQVMQPRNIRYGSAVLVWKRRRCQAIVFMVRSGRQGDFTDSEMHLLRTVYPHIRAAVGQVFSYQEERGTRRALTRALASLPLAIFVLNWDLRILQHNRAASVACARWRDGNAKAKIMNVPKRFRLPADLMKAARLLKESIGADETSPADAGCVVLHPAIPGMECSIRALPVDSGARPMFLCEVLNANDPVERATAGVDNWQRLARLTPAERQLLPYLLESASNREIAAILGKSPATVRNQLHSIFRKLNVTRRGELIPRLLH